jgi:hypothetical protein
VQHLIDKFFRNTPSGRARNPLPGIDRAGHDDDAASAGGNPLPAQQHRTPSFAAVIAARLRTPDATVHRMQHRKNSARTGAPRAVDISRRMMQAAGPPRFYRCGSNDKGLCGSPWTRISK